MHHRFHGLYPFNNQNINPSGVFCRSDGMTADSNKKVNPCNGYVAYMSTAVILATNYAKTI